MDISKKTIIEKRIARTGENLKKNNMEFYYAPTAEDVTEIVKSLIKKGTIFCLTRYKSSARLNRL